MKLFTSFTLFLAFAATTALSEPLPVLNKIESHSWLPKQPTKSIDSIKNQPTIRLKLMNPQDCVTCISEGTQCPPGCCSEQWTKCEQHSQCCGGWRCNAWPNGHRCEDCIANYDKCVQNFRCCETGWTCKNWGSEWRCAQWSGLMNAKQSHKKQ